MNELDGSVVTTTSGDLRGQSNGGVTVFRGVPYGAAPTGDARWRPAAPAPRWSGVHDALSDGPVCPQPRRSPVVDLLGDQIGDGPMSEDCLSLTIWTPAADDARRPVLVWIHGGGFIGGAGSWDIYSGAKLAERGDVVVVSINYRLGPFGYLHLGDDDTAGGNYWLTDQRLALDWILDNVAAFGGDPDRVTLGGQSGGAWSTLALLGLPEPPPIKRAAVLSAPLGIRSRSRDEAVAFTRLLREALGASSNRELRALEPGELLAALPRVLPQLARFATVTPPFMPTVDEPLVPRDVVPRVVERAADLELLVGWTANEMGFFLPLDPTLAESSRERIVERMRVTFGDRADDAYEAYLETCAGSPVDALSAYTSDELFRMPALELARSVEEHGGRAWSYQFDAASPAFDGRAGACHCVELPFFFDQLEAWQRSGGSLLAGVDAARHQPLVDEAHAALIAFVRGQAPWPTAETDRATRDLSLSPRAGDVVPQALVDVWHDCAVGVDA